MSLVLREDAVDMAVVAMCNAAGIPGSELPGNTVKNLRHQVIAFVLALNKNYEREQTYKGLWKQDSLEELGQHLVHKGKRMAVHEIEIDAEPSEAEIEAATDDAIDAINYAAFCARLVHYAALAEEAARAEEAASHGNVDPEEGAR